MVVTSDPWHVPATKILQSILDGHYRHVSTTDYVLAEAFNFIQARGRKSAAENLCGLVFGQADMAPLVDTVHKIHGARWAKSLDRYRNEFDRGLSLTDWTTIVVMEEHGIDEVATFDGGFRAWATVVDGK